MSQPRERPTLPAHARVVVIGGGVIGCSVAYHLVKRGWSDVVLLERDELTSGTTWHAAGLVSQLRATYNLTKLARYTAELFESLERETGHGTGFELTGSITIATTAERFEEIRRGASTARYCGIEVDVLSADQAVEKWPLLDPTGVVGAVYLPHDAVASPSEVTHALAFGARAGGALILEHTPVRDVRLANGRVTGVETDDGVIGCDVVVNCTGLWARDLGLASGVTIPLHAAEHFYIVTDVLPGLTPKLPYLRLLDDWSYLKSEGQKLLVGFFEPGAKPWQPGAPGDGGYIRLPEDWDHIGPYLEGAARRVPALGDVGIQLHFNGPEAFTPDDRYVLGPASGFDGYYVAAGFNSIGLGSGGGAGWMLAGWIVDGHPPMDLWDVDIRRFMPFQGNRRYLRDRTTEVLGLLYDMHWPFRQFESARGVRRTPFHDRLAARGACFGELAGWERANWYAPAGVEPRYHYSYARQNWFEHSAAEHQSVRSGVGLFDQSSFGKILVQGRDACALLNHISTANVDVAPGRVVYTQWTNERGGIEADVTVTRISPDEFLVITAGATVIRDLDFVRRSTQPSVHVFVADVSNQYAVLGLMGPRSRELLASVSDVDLSNDAFPFATSRQIDLGYATVRATRITYVGELGWELYIPSDVALHVFDTLAEAGRAVDLRPCGYHAMNSLRLEKAYRSWGHDISDEDTPLEAGLDFTIAWDKPGGFAGKEALAEQRENGVRRRLTTFVLDDPGPLLYHNEPIWRNGALVGRISSAAYGHTLGRALGLGYSTDPGSGLVTREYVESGSYEIEIGLDRYPAHASLKAPYDPTNSRIRS